MGPYVLDLDDPRADLAAAGGKGASLARLAAAGLPVPGGFHVTTAAYRAFVAKNAISTDGGEEEIAARFAAGEMPAEVAEAVIEAYAVRGRPVVAVRSSATAEDLPGMSFAGQQDSFLNVGGDDALLAAVRRCWASLWNARAVDYRGRYGISPGDVALAVVVQELVDADAAGVLFTADPVTGSRDHVVINAAWGLGEALVGGHVTPDTYTVGDAVTATIADKRVMTVRDAGGTREAPVPADLRTRAVLTAAEAAELAALGRRIEKLYGMAMDVEWTRAGGRFAVVQARPVTGPADEGEWNESLHGTYLWTSTNLGEALPEVMTPCTWSLVQMFMNTVMSMPSFAGHRLYGIIGGRFYMNISVTASITRTLGMGAGRLQSTIEQVLGKIPPGVELPYIEMSRWQLIREVAPNAVRLARRLRANAKRMPAYLAEAPRRCEELRGRVAATTTPAGLAALWQGEIAGYFRLSCHMLEAGSRRDGDALGAAHREMTRLAGEADAVLLLSGNRGDGGTLASLGPVVGLAKVAKGELSREEYARAYGHRSDNEFEVSRPRPAEDPAWIDRQLAGLAEVAGADELLAERRRARAAAWRRLERDHPRQVGRLRRQAARWSRAAHGREATRSEVIRTFWVLRDFVVRAGVLTGLSTGERPGDVYFLTVDEILARLGGGTDAADRARIAARRAVYERYRALPAYPVVVKGRFDPFRWAADPERRVDVYHEDVRLPSTGEVAGFPGAAGVVTGTVRVVASVEDGESLRPGEILVTTVTNIGWTPLFPRAAAVVTDVGAPLSHAAIVARELGIPAVVGCGNATTRLRTGDRVRVDGARGVVEILPE
ncbi:PEP/pyruvate-binding domain-containing protein [Sinosporangium siamense]|uniref:Pyruvate, water dikinase n=1 Tax=Sinosporangium siamense TaxID=1367973 RepID=A0A919RQL2_9ACTN|nr:PEP/pyruvate-binding domain-containing protein [Sinosporangium siamense]GII96611.1 hypothetical protein Ssi02_68420 [Sinosporangium siamense]